MNLITVVVFSLLCSVHGSTINHDQVQPFAEPDPVTVSEKAAVKFKPQLLIQHGCASFPAVNAAGQITGGLKGTKDIEGCEKAPLGSQMYGRSMWYQDKWAIVYAWYFPKNFWAGEAKKRHNWASMVVWIDNPAVETPKIIGASLSRQTLGPVVVGNVFGWIIPTFSDHDGIYHDLIMWDQLTDAAREALNSADFEEAKVPFNDNNFEATLAAAWPF